MERELDPVWADWSSAGGRKSPVMGAHQSFRDYIEDGRHWLRAPDVVPRKEGPPVPRIQDIGKRVTPEVLGQNDGLSKLLTRISPQLGISDVPAKIERFAKLAPLRRTTQSAESW